WKYRPTSAYGGPKVSDRALDVVSAVASEDRTKVTLELADLEPNSVVHVRTPKPFSSEDGDSLWNSEAWYTLNVLPGYVAPEPVDPVLGGIYELENGTLLGSAKVDTEHAGYSGDGF